MKAITLEQRARIYTLIQEGYSSREIAFCEKISHSTVVRIKQRKEKTGSFDIIPKPGRPRILSEQHDRNICRLIKSGECSNAIQIQKKLISNKNIIVSPNTIRHSFKRQGMVSRVKRKKPLLLKRHRIARKNSHEDLWNKIQMIWNQIDVDFCLKLIDTMPQRIADVLKASGGYTKW
ncbi:15549_t:CDS:2 [Entrophospora sp. SA101]|nr:10772_t:CDS:2 [Entrophospora sp. SA101]CAJ0897910.1 9633_t:CDS:2 [Entrophospora sp. SA101]CAJ0906811.1 15549_t:CDS:2 [Entrophospora sp. SA101]